MYGNRKVMMMSMWISLALIFLTKEGVMGVTSSSSSLDGSFISVTLVTAKRTSDMPVALLSPALFSLFSATHAEAAPPEVLLVKTLMTTLPLISKTPQLTDVLDMEVTSAILPFHERIKTFDGIPSDTETVLPSAVSPVIKTTVVTDKVLTTSSLTYFSATTQLSMVGNSSQGKPVIDKKKESSDDTTKPTTKASLSPTAFAQRCCNSEDILSDSECVTNTILFPFDPVAHLEIETEEERYNLSWETRMLNCSEGLKYKEINLQGKTATLKVNKTNTLFSWKEASFTKTTTDYCIDHEANGIYTALVCVPDIEMICSNATCLRKCCGLDEVKSHTTCRKVDNNESQLNLTFYTLSGEETEAPADLKFVSAVPNCPYKTTLSFSKIHNFPYNLLTTGKLYLKNKGQILDNKQFCVDYYTEANDDIVVYCFGPRSSVQEWKIFLSPIGMIASIIFLIIIIVCHFITRGLRNAQGLCFLTYAFVLLLAYFGFFANFQFAKEMSSSHCVFNGLFSQFSMLSAFFWLSVMCFDIWRVIRATVKCIPLTGILEKDTQKFLAYSGYAFGCPMIICIITLIMQSLPAESSNDIVVPGFGKESCWFADEFSQFIYFYSVIAILNTVSLLMLAHVLFMLCEAEQGFSCFFQERTLNSRAFNRKHLSLFRQRLSLFAVMAICWFTEVLSLKIPPKDLWVVTDLLNTFQGVIVFIIFIVSKKKRQLVKAAVVKSVSNISSVLTNSISHREESIESPETSNETDTSAKEMTVLSSRTQNTSDKTITDNKQNDNGDQRKTVKEGGLVNEGFEDHEDLHSEDTNSHL